MIGSVAIGIKYCFRFYQINVTNYVFLYCKIAFQVFAQMPESKLQRHAFRLKESSVRLSPSILFTTQHNLVMPQYTELSPTTPGQVEEDCLYPISPQLLPSTSPYVQPHPLTSAQFHSILKPPPSLSLSLLPFNYSPGHPNVGLSRNSGSFVHSSVLPYTTPGTQQPSYCLQNLQLLQLQLHHAQLQHLRHATLPR